MKNSVVNLVMAATLVVSAASAQSVASNAQPQTGSGQQVTVAFTHVPLQQALREVARQSGVKLIFDADASVFDKPVSLRAERMPAYQAIASLLSGTGLATKIASTGEVAIVRIRGGNRAVAQGSITGKILDAKTGKGVAGANVSLDADARGVVSDENGAYRMTRVSSGNHTIVVRLVGYAKQTRGVTVGEGATVTIDFKLEPSANVLDQVVVTGTVIASELRSVPNAITVITAKQIEERGITRIDQLFRGDIPGLFSVNLGSQAALDEVVMFSRGATALTSTSSGISTDPTNTLVSFNTNPIKTYIDGVEMADSKYLSQIDPSSIERIEILAGPQASTIYGSNAINGVMQIFTKRGFSNRPKLSLSLNSGVTQNNFSNAVAPNHLMDAGVTGTEGRLSYNVGGSWNYEGSWTPGKQTQRLAAYGGGRADMGKITADLSARQGLTRSKQNGRTDQVVTNLRASGVYLSNANQGLPESKTRTLNGRTVGLTLGYRPLGWWSNEMVLGSDAYEAEILGTAPRLLSVRDTALSISVNRSMRVSERYSSTMQIPLSSLGRLNLTFGGDHWRTSGSSWSASPTSLTGTLTSPSVTRSKPAKNSGAYVQGQLGIADALFFTYGVRADWNPNFGEDARVKPGRYGVSYTHDIGGVSAKLRGSYGRSIRPPAPRIALAQTAAAAELGGSVISQFGNFEIFKANPDLGPEHQQGGEGGMELYFGSRGSLIVTRFNQTVDNLISGVSGVDSARSIIPVEVPDPNFFCSSDFRDTDEHCFIYQNQYLNVGSIRNQGWELQGSVNLGPLTTRGTYSWVKSRIIGVTPKYRAFLSGSEFEKGRPFDYVPEHIWALGFTYTESRSTVSLSINGVGMRYVSADALSLATSSSSRFQLSRPRMDLGSFGSYRSRGAGYATADLNAIHRLSSIADATLQITNLTDFYENDFSALYASPGRSSRIGLRIRY